MNLLNLPLRKLEIDEEYQRMIDFNWVEHLVHNFEPDIAEIPIVSLRKGHYYVVDGQHVIHALKHLHPDDNFSVCCRVYDNLTKEQEADYFYRINQNRKRINFPSLLKAKRTSGDKEINEFIECTRRAGFNLRDTYAVNTPYGLNAVKQAYKSFQTLGAKKYFEMLSLIHDTWLGQNWATSQNVLAGMTVLMRTFKIDSERFISRLKDITATDIKRTASEFYNLPVGRKYAFAIGTLYNKYGGAYCIDLKALNTTK